MPTPAVPFSCPRSRRRGAAYLLVLSAGMLLSVIGVAVLATSRSASRSASKTADLTEASTLAEAAVEWGMAVLNNDQSWRTNYTNKTESTRKTMGRGTISFLLVDETDANLSNNLTDPVRLYGIGRVGSAIRYYSVRLTGSGGTLAVLKSAAHAGGKMSITENLTVIGGPVSSNSQLKVSSGKTLTGDASGVSVPSNGTITGTTTILSTALPMPSATVFDTYKAMATTIPYANISGGNISKKVLSPGTNTVYAAAGLNSSGVYYIHVTSGTLTVTLSRLVATLVVELDDGAKFATSGTFAWDPPRSDYPALIIKTPSGNSTVTFDGSASSLSELTNVTNFNPSGTPYPYSGGTTDTDTSDSYPTEFHGLIHIIGSNTTVALASNFKLKGVLVADGDVSTAAGVSLTVDSTIAASPPQGYTAATQMTPDAGAWKWTTAP